MNSTLSRVRLHVTFRFWGPDATMPMQRKVFRIEQMNPAHVPAPAGNGAMSSGATSGGISGLQQHEIITELKALRDLIERRITPAADLDAGQFGPSGLRQLKDETDSIQRAIARTKQEIATLHFGAFNTHGQARATQELDAVVDGTERATQQILEAAETIEEAANSLSASVKGEQDRALAQDIRDCVIRVFEACNFQDISGQRIAKVLATLKFIEDRIAHMLEIWGGSEVLRDYSPTQGQAEKKFLHGPKLDGDQDHASQEDVDAMFAKG
jgi:chemotaxis protein CheZ